VTTFGDLRIVAATNVDQVGPLKSAPVTYHWPWYWHLSRAALWLLLALAVALPKTNRDRRALLIFIPLLVLVLLWGPLARSMGMAGLSLDEFGLGFESLVVGAGLLWLNADKLGRCHGLMRFAVSLGLVLLGGCAGLISYGETSWADAAPFLSAIAVLGVILLAALGATRRFARGRYRPLRFMLHLGIWDILCSMAGIIAFYLSLEALAGFPGTPSLWSAVTTAAGAALMFAVCLYAINLPYMLLMFSSPFFRQRFQDWLGAAPLSVPDEKVQNASTL
jgi:hypothetical protein